MKFLFRMAVLVAVGMALAPSSAQAAEPEQVVVRNRRFSTAGKVEASLAVGATAVNYLTQHLNFSGAVTFNIDEPYAIVALGGYALSSHTQNADDVARALAEGQVSTSNKLNDFSDLWQMAWSAGLAFQWSPIYGKMNIAAEAPVNFKFYFLGGGGMGGFFRDSIVYCVGGNPGAGKNCSANPQGADLSALHQEMLKPFGLVGAGLRVFATQDWSFTLELRDVIFQDTYLTDIDKAQLRAQPRGAAEQDPTLGTEKSGFTHLPFVQIGATYAF